MSINLAPTINYLQEFDEKHGKLFKQITSKEIAQAFWGVFLASSGFRGFFQVYIGFRKMISLGPWGL